MGVFRSRDVLLYPRAAPDFLSLRFFRLAGIPLYWDGDCGYWQENLVVPYTLMRHRAV